MISRRLLLAAPALALPFLAQADDGVRTVICREGDPSYRDEMRALYTDPSVKRVEITYESRTIIVATRQTYSPAESLWSLQPERGGSFPIVVTHGR